MAKVDMVDFSFDQSEYPKLVGKRFQVLLVDDDASHLPFLATRDGDGLRSGAVYVRRPGMTVEASNDEMQAVINRRIETGHSTQREIDLKTHLDQLRLLYSYLGPSYLGLGEKLGLMAIGLSTTPNPNYPKEDLEAFVIRMIKQKKTQIEFELGLYA